MPRQSEHDGPKLPTTSGPKIQYQLPTSYFRDVSPTTFDIPEDYGLDLDHGFQTGSLNLSLQLEPESFSSSSSPFSPEDTDDLDSFNYRYKEPTSWPRSHPQGLSGDDLEAKHKNSSYSSSDSLSPSSVDSGVSWWYSTDLSASAGFVKRRTRRRRPSHRSTNLLCPTSTKSASSVDSGVYMLPEDDIKQSAISYMCYRCSRSYLTHYQLSLHLSQTSCYVCCGETFASEHLQRVSSTYLTNCNSRKLIEYSITLVSITHL